MWWANLTAIAKQGSLSPSFWLPLPVAHLPPLPCSADSSVSHFKLLQWQRTTQHEKHSDTTESYISPVKALKNIKGHANKWLDLYRGEERRQKSETFSPRRWTVTSVHGVPWNKPLRNSYIQPLSWVTYPDSLKATYPSYLGKRLTWQLSF